MQARLKLIALIFAVVLAGYATGSLIDWFRMPGVQIDSTALLDEIRSGRGAPSLGPAGADRTVVVFTDYRCTVCRIDHEGLEQVIRTRPDVRFVFKEWAILGAPSRAAARAALAAGYQGRYRALRDALMRSGRLDDAGMRAAAAQAGVDWPRLHRDLGRQARAIDAELARTSRQAFALGLPGTPAYLVGDRLVVGRLPASKLMRLLDREP